MFFVILNIVAPVFLVIVAGFAAVRSGLFADAMIDGVMRFAVLFAVPCLLFRAVSTLKLGDAFDWRLVLAFYSGALISFTLASTVARRWFGRKPGEAVAVGFVALFSNLLLLGLPISERAWGRDELAPVYAIVSLHAPFCYLVGISVMEWLRSDGRSGWETARIIGSAMFRNSLMIGIGLGFLVNFSGLVLPEALGAAIDLLARAALPAALFALGGVLARYRLKQTLGEVSMVTLMSLFVHPLLVYLICLLLGVEQQQLRKVVLMAAMAPGLNSYLFAVLYQRGQETAASTVLLATVLSVGTVSLWLWWLMPV
ncbi:MAG: AEC family transporter [Thiothrix sp.]|nr:AEC family transporter [Thiothrix sp.]HPQ96467.1 AEC family transporter [Thiolinea sp.]